MLPIYRPMSTFMCAVVTKYLLHSVLKYRAVLKIIQGLMITSKLKKQVSQRDKRDFSQLFSVWLKTNGNCRLGTNLKGV